MDVEKGQQEIGKPHKEHKENKERWHKQTDRRACADSDGYGQQHRIQAVQRSLLKVKHIF